MISLVWPELYSPTASLLGNAMIKVSGPEPRKKYFFKRGIVLAQI